MYLYIFEVFSKKVTNKSANIKKLILGTINIIPPLAFDGKEDVEGSLKTAEGKYIYGYDVLFSTALADNLGYELDIKVYGIFLKY